MNEISLKVKKWLIENERFINSRSLEREIGCSRGLLRKWIKNDYTIPQKWINKLYPIIEKITEV